MGETKFGRGRPLGEEDRERILRLWGEGLAQAEIAARVGCGVRTVQRTLERSRLRRKEPAGSGRSLGFAERERISRGLARGERPSQIARALGRARSTVSREIARNGGPRAYRAVAAERRAIAQRARPKPTKLSRSPRLRRAVARGLARRWSPQQISARLRVEHPGDEEMRISHETIYRALYVQARGELRREVARALRSGRTQRRPRKAAQERRGRIPGMVPIAERPPEADSRAVPGHWEGDLLLGRQGRSAVVTLVERRTRYVLLAQLGRERTTERVTQALKERIRDLPRHLVLSLTWDQGKELAAHARFSVDTGVDVYFCDPHSPWQRGTNENTNGLLRQYLPKGEDLSRYSQEELDRIAAELNDRPRQTLGWMKPSEKMNELLLR